MAKRKLFFAKLCRVEGKGKGIKLHDLKNNEIDDIFSTIKKLPLSKDEKLIDSKKSRYYKDYADKIWHMRFADKKNEIDENSHEHMKDRYEILLFGKKDDGVKSIVESANKSTEDGEDGVLKDITLQDGEDGEDGVLKDITLQDGEDIYIHTLVIVDKKHSTMAYVLDGKIRGPSTMVQYLEDLYNSNTEGDKLTLKEKVEPDDDIEKKVAEMDIKSYTIVLGESMIGSNVSNDILSGGVNMLISHKEPENSSNQIRKLSIIVSLDKNNNSVQQKVKSFFRKNADRDFDKNLNIIVKGEDKEGDDLICNFYRNKLSKYVELDISDRKISYDKTFEKIIEAYCEIFADKDME